MSDDTPPMGWRPEWARKDKPAKVPDAVKYAAPLPDDLGPSIDFDGPLPVIFEGLCRLAARREYAILLSASTSVQDVNGALAVLRLGSRVGADKVATKRPKLRVGSIMPTKAAPAPTNDPAPNQPVSPAPTTDTAPKPDETTS